MIGLGEPGNEMAEKLLTITDLLLGEEESIILMDMSGKISATPVQPEATPPSEK